MVNKPETMAWCGKKIHYTLVHYMEMMPNLFLTMKLITSRAAPTKDNILMA